MKNCVSDVGFIEGIKKIPI